MSACNWVHSRARACVRAHALKPCRVFNPCPRYSCSRMCILAYFWQYRLSYSQDGGGEVERKELAAGLFRLGIWLHPKELMSLFSVLDEVCDDSYHACSYLCARAYNWTHLNFHCTCMEWVHQAVDSTRAQINKRLRSHGHTQNAWTKLYARANMRTIEFLLPIHACTLAPCALTYVSVGKKMCFHLCFMHARALYLTHTQMCTHKYRFFVLIFACVRAGRKRHHWISRIQAFLACQWNQAGMPLLYRNVLCGDSFLHSLVQFGGNCSVIMMLIVFWVIFVTHKEGLTKRETWRFVLKSATWNLELWIWEVCAVPSYKLEKVNCDLRLGIMTWILSPIDLISERGWHIWSLAMQSCACHTSPW